MKNTLTFVLAFLLTTSSIAQVVNFIPTSGSANATSPSNVSFIASLAVPFGPGSINAFITSIIFGAVTPATASSSFGSFNGDLTMVTIAVSIPSGLTVGSTVTVPITLNHAASGGFGPYTATGTFTFTINAVLAAELTAFNGKSEQGKNLLEWVTASEKDNKKFVIEQSNNGLDFKSIGEVKGTGTTQLTNQYTFTDENPAKNINYYRLKTISLDGIEGLSKVVAITSKGVLNTKVTPSVQGAKIEIVSDHDGAASIDILNLNGQIVASQMVEMANGFSEHLVSFNQSGMFIIQVKDGKSMVSTKFFRN
jgi:hypothetical protein